MPFDKTVLVVDDAPENIDVLKAILKGTYNIRVATDGHIAVKIAESAAPPDIILLDVVMPGFDGYEVCKALKNSARTRDIPVIFVTAQSDVDHETLGFALGAVDYITKPVSPPVVHARVATHLALRDRSRLLEQLVAQRTALLERRTQELEQTRRQILQRLGRAVDFRDNETGMHVLRISQYVSLLAQKVGLADLEIEKISQAALMHDIGKIGVPDQILLKPGKLTATEFEIVKRHCVIGAEIIGQHDSPLLEACRVVALTHHERWDGSGYPNKLVGADIPLIGRLTAIADVFDALTCARVYKAPWPIDKALDTIQSEAGKAFDPTLVPLFVSSRHHLEEIMAHHAEPLLSLN